MRNVTPQEAEKWTALARQHGHTNEDGDIAIGRFRVTREAPGQLLLTFVTPVVADLYTEDLKRKTPPIQFDRNEQGEIILPGRWWGFIFERAAEGSRNPQERAELMRIAGQFQDSVLPSNTDTIAFLLPDENGNLVQHEALPPGGKVVLTLHPHP